MEISSTRKIGYGMLMPLLVFVAYQFVLLKSDAGNGSWNGMTVFFGTLFLVPALLVANAWVVALRWRMRHQVFAAGMVLPLLVAVVEYLFMHGPSSIHSAILTVGTAGLLSSVVVLFLPLLLVIGHAGYRRLNRQGDPRP